LNIKGDECARWFLSFLCFAFSCGVGQILPVFVARFFGEQPFVVRSLFLLTCALLLVASVRGIHAAKSSTSRWRLMSVALWAGFAAGATIIFVYGAPSGWAFLLR